LEKESGPPDKPVDGLVLVPGGTFSMGCTSEQQDCSDDEKPAHQVTLKDFYIGKFEVTQKLWQEIMGSNPSNFKDCVNCPVEQVSWEEVQDFLKKLNAKYPGKNYRLPTEAEWEYAARGGGKAVLFGNGKNIADPQEINFDASEAYKETYSIVGEYRQRTVPVGSLSSPNALGLHDMSGNVWEWCSDWYASDYYKKSPASNPTGPASGSLRVLRGGSWYDYPQFCRVAYRNYITPGYRSNVLGFRLARTK
jgi:formylglycine-generating enzyme required for sulfatase activity